MIIQTILLDPSGAVWTGEAPNVSRPDPSGAVQVDADHQATDLAGGVRIPCGAPEGPLVAHGSARSPWPHQSPTQQPTQQPPHELDTPTRANLLVRAVAGSRSSRRLVSIVPPDRAPCVCAPALIRASRPPGERPRSSTSPSRPPSPCAAVGLACGHGGCQQVHERPDRPDHNTAEVCKQRERTLSARIGPGAVDGQSADGSGPLQLPPLLLKPALWAACGGRSRPAGRPSG
jgi:hypothetical protein